MMMRSAFSASRAADDARYVAMSFAAVGAMPPRFIDIADA